MRIAVGGQHAMVEYVEDRATLETQLPGERRFGPAQPCVFAQPLDIGETQHEISTGFVQNDGMLLAIAPKSAMGISFELRQGHRRQLCCDRRTWNRFHTDFCVHRTISLARKRPISAQTTKAKRCLCVVSRRFHSPILHYGRNEGSIANGHAMTKDAECPRSRRS